MTTAASHAPSAGARPPLDWTLRVFDASPFGVLGTGLCLVLGYAALALLYALTVRPPLEAGGTWARFGWDVVNGVLIALPFTANAYARRAALRDLAALRPSVALSDAEMAAEAEAAVRPSQPWLEGASGIGVVWMTGVVFLDPGIWDAGGRPPLTSLALYWALFHNVASAYAVGRMFALEVSLTRSFARVASRLRVDLLATEKLYPVARKGQRSVMLWLLLSSVISSFWLGGGPALTNGVTLVLLLGVAALSFGVPLSRAHARIAAARGEELGRVNAELARARDALFAGAVGAPGRVADLVAWRATVANVHEWPVTMPMLLRSALFVALGLGSWIGGAVVERLLTALLG